MPTTVQHRSGFSTNANTTTLAFLSNNAAGNLLVYCGAGGATAGATATCTDNNSNTVTDSLLNPKDPGAGAGQLHLYYVKSSRAGANTVTCTDANGGSDPHVHIYEVSGCDTANPLNATGSLQAGTSTAYSVSTTGAAAVNDYVFACFLNWSAASTWTIGGGYSDGDTANNTTGLDSSFSEDKVAASAAVQTATATAAAAPGVEIALIATFLAAGGGGGPLPPLLNRHLSPPEPHMLVRM